MSTDAPSHAESDEHLLADDKRWRWSSMAGDEGQIWQLTWKAEVERRRHHDFVARHGDHRLFKPTATGDDKSLTLNASNARPLASMNWREMSNPILVGIFESLGRQLRELHELRSPSGFGDAIAGSPYHTFNAFMAAQFGELSRRTQRVDNEVLRETAMESLASLRHELSAFHPHGASTWTVGRLSPDRLAIKTNPAGVDALMDLGGVGLRPAEYDLAALHIYGLLDVLPVADRAFWRGYNAARTCDLHRRIGYFERLIELERLLGTPTLLVARS